MNTENEIAEIIEPLGRYGYTRIAVTLSNMCAQLNMTEEEIALFRTLWEDMLAGTLLDLEVFEENFKFLFPAYNMLVIGAEQKFDDKIFNIYVTKKSWFKRLLYKLFKVRL